MDAPLEVRILHQSSISELPLEELVNFFVQDVLEEDVQVGEVFQGVVVRDGWVVQFGELAEGTDAVGYRSIGDLEGKWRKLGSRGDHRFENRPLSLP